MTFELRVAHEDGSVDTLSITDPDSLGDTDTPSMDAVDLVEKLHAGPGQPHNTGRVSVYRDAWQDLTFDRNNDEFYVYETPSGSNDLDEERARFGGRFFDSETQGQIESLILHGPKRDAITGEPSGQNDTYDKDASNIVVDIVTDRLPTFASINTDIEAGVVEFSESNASPARSLTKLAEQTDTDLVFTWSDKLGSASLSDWGVRFVRDYGFFESTELSARNGTLFGDPRVRRKSEAEITHLRVLGAGEGTAQIEATAVSDTYEDGERTVWKNPPYSDKDIQQPGRAQDVADTLMAEYQTEPEYVEATVSAQLDFRPLIGSSFPVSIPGRNLDRRLQLLERRRIVDRQGDRYELTLSNRKFTRQPDSERRARATTEFQISNPGQYFFNSEPYGWESIGPNTDRGIILVYPENVIRELRSEIRLRDQGFRAEVAHDGSNNLTAGITKFPSETVSNVGVDIVYLDEDKADETIATGLEPPLAFEDPIDVTGKLEPGRNRIKVTSDSLGQIEVKWVIEGIKNA